MLLDTPRYIRGATLPETTGGKREPPSTVTPARAATTPARTSVAPPSSPALPKTEQPKATTVPAPAPAAAEPKPLPTKPASREKTEVGPRSEATSPGAPLASATPPAHPAGAKDRAATTPARDSASAGADRDNAFAFENGTVRISLTTTAASVVAAGLVVAGVILWVAAYSLGSASADARLATSLEDDAGRAVEASGAGAPDPGLLEPRIREPRSFPAETSAANAASGERPDARVTATPTVRLAPDEPSATPAVAAPANEVEPLETAVPEQDRYADTREPGMNYLALGQLSDRTEAIRTVDFLIDNGVPAIAVEGRDRAGNTQFRLFTLFGVPGEGFRSNPDRIDHMQRVIDLGEVWISEHRGRLNFSNSSQVQWTKYNPGG